MNPTSADSAALLLEQPNRRRIVDHLEQVPGDHFRSIVRALHLSRGTVRYHLLVLKREGLVRSDRIAGKCRYFAMAKGVAPERNDLYKKYWAHTDLRARVWSAVLRLPDPRPSTIAAALGLSRQLAAYHLKRLAKEGRVVPSGGSYLPADARKVAVAADRTREPRPHLDDAFGLGAAMRCMGHFSRAPAPPAFRYPAGPQSPGFREGLAPIAIPAVGPL